jgi:hypothetical protein
MKNLSMLGIECNSGISRMKLDYQFTNRFSEHQLNKDDDGPMAQHVFVCHSRSSSKRRCWFSKPSWLNVPSILLDILS